MGLKNKIGKFDWYLELVENESIPNPEGAFVLERLNTQLPQAVDELFSAMKMPNPGTSFLSNWKVSFINDYANARLSSPEVTSRAVLAKLLSETKTDIDRFLHRDVEYAPDKLDLVKWLLFHEQITNSRRHRPDVYLVDERIWDYVMQTMDIHDETPLQDLISACARPTHVLLPQGVLVSIYPTKSPWGTPTLDMCIAFWIIGADDTVSLSPRVHDFTPHTLKNIVLPGDSPSVFSTWREKIQDNPWCPPGVFAMDTSRYAEETQRMNAILMKVPQFIPLFLMLLSTKNVLSNLVLTEANPERLYLQKKLAEAKQYKKEKLRKELEEIPSIQVIDIFLTLSAVAKEYVTKHRDAKDPNAPVGPPVATHIRRGHNHRFRTGARDAAEPTYVWHFIPTMIINAGMGPVPYLFQNIK